MRTMRYRDAFFFLAALSALGVLAGCRPAPDSGKGETGDSAPDSGDSADSSGDSADSGDSAGDSSGDSNGTGDSAGDTADTGGDTGVAFHCLELVPTQVVNVGEWTVDWSGLTTDLDGATVSPRDVDGGAVYAYALTPAEVQAAVCGAGLDGADLYDYAFFDVLTVPPPQATVGLDATEGGSLLVRLDKAGGTFLMYGLFEVLPTAEMAPSKDGILAITSDSAAWSD